MPDFRTDPAVTARLRTSFAEVQTHGDQLAEAFYRRLFSMQPELRPMFTTDPAVQRQKVMDSLAAIVGVLDDHPGFDAYLAELGARHVGYGVTNDQYDVVVRALSGAFGDVLGPSMSPDLAAEWRDTLTHISERMMNHDGLAS